MENIITVKICNSNDEYLYNLYFQVANYRFFPFFGWMFFSKLFFQKKIEN